MEVRFIKCPECNESWATRVRGRNESRWARSSFLKHYRAEHVGIEFEHYTSTYCMHDLHEQCRLTCKICAGACKCTCHHAATQAQDPCTPEHPGISEGEIVAYVPPSGRRREGKM